MTDLFHLPHDGAAGVDLQVKWLPDALLEDLES